MIGRRRPRSRRGVSALEIALVTPMLLGFLLAITDLGTFVSNTSRATSAAAAAADLIAQTETFEDKANPDTVTSGKELGVVYVAAREVASPLDLYGQGTVIITLMVNNGPGTCVNWVRRWGLTDIASKVSTTSMRGIVLAKGESVVFAEVGYKFRPYILSGKLLGLDQNMVFQTIAARRPRLTGPALTPTPANQCPTS